MPSGCYEPNLCLLQKQHVVLSIKPLLQAPALQSYLTFPPFSPVSCFYPSVLSLFSWWTNLLHWFRLFLFGSSAYKFSVQGLKSPVARHCDKMLVASETRIKEMFTLTWSLVPYKVPLLPRTVCVLEDTPVIGIHHTEGGDLSSLMHSVTSVRCIPAAVCVFLGSLIFQVPSCHHN